MAADRFRVVVGQKMLAPQLHLSRIDQRFFYLASVFLPTPFELLKENVMRFRSADELHQFPLRRVGKRLVGNDDAQGVAHIEENCVRHSFYLLCFCHDFFVYCFHRTVRPFISDRMGMSSSSSLIT